MSHVGVIFRGLMEPRWQRVGKEPLVAFLGIGASMWHSLARLFLASSPGALQLIDVGNHL